MLVLHYRTWLHSHAGKANPCLDPPQPQQRGGAASRQGPQALAAAQQMQHKLFYVGTPANSKACAAYAPAHLQTRKTSMFSWLVGGPFQVLKPPNLHTTQRRSRTQYLRVAQPIGFCPMGPFPTRPCNHSSPTPHHHMHWVITDNSCAPGEHHPWGCRVQVGGTCLTRVTHHHAAATCTACSTPGPHHKRPAGCSRAAPVCEPRPAAAEDTRCLYSSGVQHPC